jgi:hypothetical protein
MEPSQERLEELREVATHWRSEGRFLAAALAMSRTIDAGWGSWTAGKAQECVYATIGDLNHCIETCTPSSIESLLALWLKAGQLSHFALELAAQQRHIREESLLNLAERLTSHYWQDPHAASFLVQGFQVCGEVIGPWTAEFPAYEVDRSATFYGGGRFCFNLPSAFRLLIDAGDYRGAWQIGEAFDGAFVSPGLRGWRLAVEGLICPDRAQDLFERAADAFMEDTIDRPRQAGQGWSSVNRDLWAPYFRSRARVAQAVVSPHTSEQLISAAAEIAPPFGGWHDTVVYRYHLLIRAVAGILGVKNGLDPREARKEFEREIRIFGERGDAPAVLEFLENAVRGFDRLQQDRRQGLTAVGRAMAALDRLPFIKAPEAEGVRVVLDQGMLELIEGPTRVWIYRTLGSITDERKLQRILLRVFQNAVHHYAQIRHGPIEYGKDIAVVAEENQQMVLRMYQVKCGDIDRGEWNKVRPQAEEIFQVPLDSFQLPCQIDRRVGILIWNGHAKPHVEPVMQGWANDQTALGRCFEFMHLDRIVGYIFEHRLISALRDALAEERVQIKQE